MNKGHFWSDDDIQRLRKTFAEKPSNVSIREFAKKYSGQYKLTETAVRCKINDMGLKSIIRESPYPKFDSPLVMEGDAVVLPDLEMPFHHAEFTNRVLDLSQSWGIKQAILAGDVLHFDSLSGWEPNWAKLEEGGIVASAEEKLMEFSKSLPAKKQGELMELIGNIGQRSEADGVSTELGIARKELHKITELFDKVDFVLGNHEGRLLRALQTTLDPQEVKRLLEGGDKWRIAEYYFSYLDTAQGRYQIEHPKNASKFSASRLASKHLCHILMAHSHQLNFTFDPSGTYYAIEMGCMVDENRLAYVAQRHNTSPTHRLGAVIVRDGYPWLLHAGTDWERMRGI
jgi:hypothetical protein